jgi:hypothetical protein
MSTYNVASKIHVWIGVSPKSREEFSQYFIINLEDRAAEIGTSQFGKDVNIQWYDDDLIGVYYNEANTALEEAVEEIPTSPNSIQEIRERCAELNINKANAMFYYEDAELRIIQPKEKYNGLTYLGVFNNI